MTVIADDREVHDIGGIMGGEHSGVTEATTDILIECAYFDPEHIALTGQKLGLVLRRAQPLRARRRSRLRRGRAAARDRDGDRARRRRAFADRPRRRAARCRDKIVDYDPARCAGPRRHRRARGPAGGDPAAARLHRDPRQALADRGAVMASRRGRRRRHRRGGRSGSTGIDKVPSTPLPRAPGVARPTATAEQLIERKARRTAAARGLNEAVTWSFISGSRGGAVRRRGLDPRQSDQRGDEGDAALAAPRPARRGRAQHGARRRRRSAVRDRAALSRR